jgi:branched-chain amino acid transport system substrate-binding protein
VLLCLCGPRMFKLKETSMPRFVMILSSLVWVLMFAPAQVLASGDVIHVGVLLPLTGDQARFGEMEKNSFLMAAEEINEAGGIHGRPIRLLIEDDMGKPEAGRASVEKLISQGKVVCVTGGYSSEVVNAICPAIELHKVPFLVSTAAADKITEQGWKYTFRIKVPVSEYTESLESFLADVVQPRSVAILYQNTPFGQSGSKQFAERCSEMGIKVLMKEGYSPAVTDFKPLLIKTKAANPDLVYMIGYVTDASLLLPQAKELDLNPKLFVGGGAGFTLPEFGKIAGDAAQYVFSTDLWTRQVPYEGAQDYYDKFLKQFGFPPDYHGAEAYASMYVVADALKRAKELTPQALRDALASTDMMTAYGPVKFVTYGSKRQQNSIPTYVSQWQNGSLETIWPKALATKPYIYPVPPWKSRK